jgi:hypothetical protein
MTGTIGWVPGRICRPAAVRPARNRVVWRSSLSRSAVEPLIRRSAARLPATIGGARVFENRYGRLRLRSRSMISRLPLVKPPEAPPRALPRVEV